MKYTFDSEWIMAYKYVEINALFGRQLWRKLQFVCTGNIQSEVQTGLLISVGSWKVFHMFTLTSNQ